jgi:hypothetical protein
LKYLGVILSLLFATRVYCVNISHLITEKEFIHYSHLIAHKVDVFREVWRQDPRREFFGGSVRDYLYWLKTSLYKNASNRQEALKYLDSLVSESSLSAKMFLHPNSDLDTIHGIIPVHSAPDWELSRIENSSANRFTPGTSHYQNEIDQGFISIEKLRLSFREWIFDSVFGDPFESIYYGDYSKAHLGFPDWTKFKSTYFARVNINHPVLLSLRILRVLNLEPDSTIILQQNPALKETLAFWINHFFSDNDHKGHRFYFSQFKFKQFFNSNLDKTWFQSPNPKLTLELWKQVGLWQKLSQVPLNEPLKSTLFGFEELSSTTINLPNAKQLEHLVLSPNKLSSHPYFIFMAESETEYFKALSEGFWIKPRKKDKVGSTIPLITLEDYTKHAAQSKKHKYLIKVFLKPETRVVDIAQGLGAKHWSKFDGNEKAYAGAMGAEIIRVPGKPSQNNVLLLTKQVIEKAEPFDLKEFAELSKNRPPTPCQTNLSDLIQTLKN